MGRGVVTLARIGYYLLTVCMLLMIAACSNQTNAVSMQRTPVPSRQATPASAGQVTPTSAQVVPVVQQRLPKGLLKAGYSVMDWVFNTTCGRAVDSY